MKLSDIYKDVTTVWDSNRDIILFHIILYIILVFWFGVAFSFPELKLDKIANLTLTNNNYYILLKDSGFLVAIPAFIILLLLIYFNLVKSIV